MSKNQKINRNVNDSYKEKARLQSIGQTKKADLLDFIIDLTRKQNSDVFVTL